jgi:hypothetical protein
MTDNIQPPGIIVPELIVPDLIVGVDLGTTYTGK